MFRLSRTACSNSMKRIGLIPRNGRHSGLEFLGDVAAPPLLDQGLQHGLAVIRKTIRQCDRREHPGTLLSDIGLTRHGRQRRAAASRPSCYSARPSSRGRTSRRPARAAADPWRSRLAPSRRPSCPKTGLRWSGNKGPRRNPAPAGRRRPKSTHPVRSSAANRVGARVAAGAGAGESAAAAARSVYTRNSSLWAKRGAASSRMASGIRTKAQLCHSDTPLGQTHPIAKRRKALMCLKPYGSGAGDVRATLRTN